MQKAKRNAVIVLLAVMVLAVIGITQLPKLFISVNPASEENTDESDNDKRAESSEHEGSAETIPLADYPVNANGQSYGPRAEDGLPDLLSTQASNGREGYIYREDFTDPGGSASDPYGFTMNRYRQATTAFIDYVYQATGVELVYDEVDLAVNHSSFSGSPWMYLSDKQKDLILNLLPENIRSEELAQGAFDASREINYIIVPVYESDGETQIGEIIVK
jgi:hypothetical protein